MDKPEVVGSANNLTIDSSRGEAVSQVFRGVLKTVFGSAGFLLGGYGLLGVASIPIALPSIFIAGAGLLHFARATRHFRRFGSSTAVIGLSGAGILGATVILWGLAIIPQLLGLWRVPGALRTLIPFLALGSGFVVLITVLLGIARLITQAAEDRRGPVAPAPPR